MPDKRKHVPTSQSLIDYHLPPIRKLLGKFGYKLRDEEPYPVGVSEEQGRFVVEGYITYKDIKSLWLYAIASNSEDKRLSVGFGQNIGWWRNLPDLGYQFILRPEITLKLLKKMRMLHKKRFTRTELFLMSVNTTGMDGARLIKEYEAWHEEEYEAKARYHSKVVVKKWLLDESRRLAIRLK